MLAPPANNWNPEFNEKINDSAWAIGDFSQAEANKSVIIIEFGILK